MKKIITLATLLAVSGLAFANVQANTSSQPTQTEQQMVFGAVQDDKHAEGKKADRFEKRDGNFIDESTMLKTLNEAANAPDNAGFMIEGNIVKQVGKKDFIFKDAAGTEHQIEISKRAWHGETFTPADTVTIIGKVDKEANKTELEVKDIRKAAAQPTAAQ